MNPSLGLRAPVGRSPHRPLPPPPIPLEETLPEPSTPLVTTLAVIGLAAFVLAPIAWRYAVTELRKIDDGDLRAAQRRAIDHARVLAMVTTIVYAFMIPFGISLRS